MIRSLASLILGLFLAAPNAIAADPAKSASAATKPPCVFDLPMISATQQAVTLLFSRGEYERAARSFWSMPLKTIPQDCNVHYNLTCALARLGNTGRPRWPTWKSRSNSAFPMPTTLRADDDLTALAPCPASKRP